MSIHFKERTRGDKLITYKRLSRSLRFLTFEELMVLGSDIDDILDQCFLSQASPIDEGLFSDSTINPEH